MDQGKHCNAQAARHEQQIAGPLRAGLAHESFQPGVEQQRPGQQQDIGEKDRHPVGNRAAQYDQDQRQGLKYEVGKPEPQALETVAILPPQLGDKHRADQVTDPAEEYDGAYIQIDHGGPCAGGAVTKSSA